MEFYLELYLAEIKKNMTHIIFYMAHTQYFSSSGSVLLSIGPIIYPSRYRITDSVQVWARYKIHISSIQGLLYQPISVF